MVEDLNYFVGILNVGLQCEKKTQSVGFAIRLKDSGECCSIYTQDKIVLKCGRFECFLKRTEEK